MSRSILFYVDKSVLYIFSIVKKYVFTTGEMARGKNVKIDSNTFFLNV